MAPGHGSAHGSGHDRRRQQPRRRALASAALVTIVAGCGATETTDDGPALPALPSLAVADPQAPGISFDDPDTLTM
ncbi:MAG: hypothetical protein GX542_05905, partial [Rhodococcus sp.]|nr:hypothetical protein [Rhodococcus sp. (in: high G+C Gram-positive bacteria)]